MGTCLVKLPHEACGSSDALQVFENEDGGVSGFCFSCGTYLSNPFGEPKKAKDLPKEMRVTKTPEEVEQELNEIGQCSSYDLASRRLRKSTLDAFDVKVGVSEVDGKTPRLVYFPYTKDGRVVRYKCRMLDEKRMWSYGKEKDWDLFGWEQAVKKGAKRLIITEGEYDAMALDRINELRGDPKWKDMVAIVSVTNGASGAAKELTRASEKIRKHFKEVSLCFDNDEPGQKALQECLKVLPYATVITLPAKDANDCLMSEKLMKAAHAAMTFNHTVAKNTRIVRGTELREAAKKKPEYGLSYPFAGLTKLTRGIRRGETYYWGAGVKMG